MRYDAAGVLVTLSSAPTAVKVSVCVWCVVCVCVCVCVCGVWCAYPHNLTQLVCTEACPTMPCVPPALTEVVVVVF